jgi:hypothetical protein
VNPFGDDDREYYFTEDEYRQLMEKRLCPYLYFDQDYTPDGRVVYIAVCKLLNLGGGMRKRYVLEYCAGNYRNCTLIKLLQGEEK